MIDHDARPEGDGPPTGGHAGEARRWSSCSWCHRLVAAAERTCPGCKHDAHSARMLCLCRRCVAATPPEPPTDADIDAAIAGLRRPADGDGDGQVTPG